MKSWDFSDCMSSRIKNKLKMIPLIWGRLRNEELQYLSLEWTRAVVDQE
jgi:hypothetical protein